MATVTDGRLFGKSIKRREDPRFITGRGTYVDDVKLPGMTYAAFVRSPHAHAKIKAIDSARATKVPGVLAVYTGQDVRVGGLPCGWMLPGIKVPTRPALAQGKTRYVGEPVAIVIGETAYAAKDGAEAVKVTYEALPGVSDGKKAHQKGAPQLFDEIPSNECFYWTIGDKAATEAAFKSAATVVSQPLLNQRLIPNAMEPRACLASYSTATDELTLWVTSQNPHVHRLLMAAFVLTIPETKMRVIAPDVGGGFGSKIFVYNEEVVVSWAARALKRPLKWTAERRESFLNDAHGRDHVTEAEMAFDRDGKVTGLRVKTHANLGAYLSTFAPLIPSFLYGPLLSGVYKIPAIFCEVWGMLTNTAPVDAYRGAGRPEATYLLERLMDRAARQLKLDPVELRRKNFIPAFTDGTPYQTPVAFAYDSGNYEPALRRALELVGYEQTRKEQAAGRRSGKYIGIGVSTYIEACGPAPSAVAGSLGAGAGLWESGQVRVDPTGTVTVFTGSHSHGQGHETTFAQIVADELGIPMEQVEVVHGDTGRIPFGMGTYGSRSACVGGSAIVKCLDKIKEKGRKIAAHLLEAGEQDLVFQGGAWSVKGSPDKKKAWGEVALMAYLAHNIPQGMEPGLEATSFYDPVNFTFPFGTHIAVVEVDPETGAVKILKYVAVDDVGRVINPMIVDGMVHGGIAQGIGQALWEHGVYADDGQLVTATMMDYAMPKADALPSYVTDRTVTPSPINPLGVKGAGETGTIASTPAIANAVMDAIEPFGVRHLDMPLTPGKIWKAVAAAKKK
ncbi:MAG TPA: xanthine dehydrogenase family protein molybdopterin-binding subunit [Methylomirabilota bacterium]|nr:xanthine dehydrogenase family protein molybdopterin-binding subunit [Methylomirabilota bacterium]